MMIRKQFLATPAGMGIALYGEPKVPWFRGKRTSTECDYEVSAPPEAVFPLLCPVREYEWLDGWSCEMIYSQSGVAEVNCIFRTQTPFGRMTWNVNRYEPPFRIDFVTVVPDHLVTRLSIALEPVGTTRTKLRWTRLFTGLSSTGNDNVAAWTLDREKELGRKLEHFLKTGTMLRKEKA